MSFTQFLRILWARQWAVSGMVLFGVLVALVLSFVLPPRYRATTTVVIDFKGMDPVAGLMAPAQMMPGYMSTQFDIIHSHRVALKVVRDLKISQNAVARQQFLEATGGRGSIDDWFADLLLDKLEVRPTRDSSVISIEYTSPDPTFSAAIADAFAKAYIDTNLELRVAPARETAVWFDEQIKHLRDNLAEAQAKLSAYQRQKGISATDERLDVETGRLTELSQQYTAAQAAAADALSRQRQLSEFMARGASPESLPDILANPVIQGLKTQLANSGARLEQLASQLGANHPEIQRLKADIAEQRQQLASEIETVSAAIGNAARLAQRRQSELAQAVADQKARMLRLNQGRDDMAVLIKEVENAQRALDAANSRLTQENLQSRSSQTNVMVLSAAVPPLEPAFPKLSLNIPLGILAGLFLGVNLALLREFFDWRVRSPEDLKDLGEVPVLGVLRKLRSGDRRRVRLRFPRIGARVKMLPA
jgi:chain length determinant protein EpsF